MNFMLTSCFGAQSRNRTNDTGIFSPLLYRLSYLGLKRDRLAGAGPLATQKGLEPSTSSVTGWHSKPTELLRHEPSDFSERLPSLAKSLKACQVFSAPCLHIFFCSK